MKLKELRKNMGHTQQKLAEMLDVNQQTVARWENGKTEPSIAQLKDLAMIYQTSVDAILGKVKPISPFPKYWHPPEKNVHEEYFFGYLGITLLNGELTRWFPVTDKVVNRFLNLTWREEDEIGWEVFETLNNRYVAVNLNNVTSFTINDDDADEPVGDWKYTYFEDMLPDEMYRGLANHWNQSDYEKTSAKYKATIDDYVKENKLDEEKLNMMFDFPKIYGKKKLMYDSIFVNYKSLAQVYYYIDMGIHNKEYLRITDFEEGNYYLLNNKEIAMIDSSRIHVLDAMEENLRDMQEDVEESSENKKK